MVLFCFPRLRLGKYWDFRETKFTVPRPASGPTLLADGFFLLGPVTRAFRANVFSHFPLGQSVSPPNPCWILLLVTLTNRSVIRVLGSHRFVAVVIQIKNPFAYRFLGQKLSAQFPPKHHFIWVAPVVGYTVALYALILPRTSSPSGLCCNDDDDSDDDDDDDDHHHHHQW